MGTAREALEFARRACDYLRPKGVESVEAWSLEMADGKSEISEQQFEIENLLRFCVKRHENGQDWVAEPNELHHGGWWRELRQAIDYALYRGNGRICAVEIFEPRMHWRAAKANQHEFQIQQVVLVDRRGQDSCPTQGRRLNSEG